MVEHYDHYWAAAAAACCRCCVHLSLLLCCNAGAAFKEAVHINGGLLALGNVIVALSGGHEDGPEGAEGDKAAVLNTGGSVTARAAAKKHIPYRCGCCYGL
jgi:hypothetical protein